MLFDLMQGKSKWVTDATKRMTIAMDFREPGIWVGSRTYRKDFGVDDICLDADGQVYEYVKFKM
jgi:hypothetical protein